VEILPYIGGLTRNEVQCLHDFHIPLLLEHTVTEIHGQQRLEAVTIAKVNKDKKPVNSTERIIECDTVLLSVGLIPENELSRMAGVVLDPLTGGPVVDQWRETNVSGIFAGGNVVHVHDLVDNVSWEAEIAGASAAKFARKEETKKEKKILKPGRNIRYVVPQSISAQHDVTLYARVKDMEENVTLKVGDILSKSLRVVKPGEMLKIDLSHSKLRELKDDSVELSIESAKRRQNG
jgi:NADH dehydrogenase FAD-containing subunit